MSKQTVRHFMKPLDAAMLLALLAPALPAAANPSYVITDLTPSLPPGWTSSGTAINSVGQVAGSSGANVNSITAVIWQSNGSITNLGTLQTGGGISHAFAINDSGQVVGQSSTGPVTSQAFSWNGSKLTGLLPAPASGESTALGVNNAGQIVGSVPSDGSTSAVDVAAFWRDSTKEADALQILNIAHAINNKGLAVGEESTIDGPQAYYVVGPNGVPVQLPSLAVGSVTQALAVNDSGQVVGNNANTSNGNHAVLWQSSSSSQAPLDLGFLGALNDTVNSSANAINANGQVVGASTTTKSISNAFFWYNSGGTGVMVNLNDPKMVSSNLQGLTLVDARGINAYGQITGEATNAAFDTHAFLATPTGSLNWTSANAGAWDNPTNWQLGFVPNKFLDIVIAPQSGGVTVSGPVAATTVNSLTVGGGAGSARLDLASALTVTKKAVDVQTGGEVNVLTGGTLALTGTGSISNASGVANNGSFDISGTTAGASITSLSGTGNVALGAQTLTLTNASGTFSGAINGAGGNLVLSGGVETLSGSNSYTGLTKINTGASLVLAGAGSIAASSGVADNGNLDISGTSAGASISSLSGTGGVALGTQTLTLTNASGVFSGAINGTGGFTLAGGSETLAGSNTYTGTTTVSNGALSLGSGGALANSSKLVVNGGAFDLGTNSQTLAGVQLLSGSIANGNLASTSNYDLQSGTVSANLGGAVALVKSGSGTVVLTGSNTYGGGTTVSAGTLQGNVASLQGNIVNNAAIIFDQATDGAFAGSLSGSGSLIKQGAGLLALAGANTVGGSLTVAAGTLVNQGVLQALTNLTNLSGGKVINASGGIININEGGQMVNAGAFSNLGTVNLQGVWADAGNASASLNNQGTINISGSGSHVINGDVLNQGTVNVHETSVVFTGNFDNQGAYVSDPSTSQFHNLSVGQNGYISGGPQDTFIVTGNFMNASTQNTQWNTANANLVFTSPTPGQTAQHQMQLASADQGAKASGAVNNFAWGSVTLAKGDSLTLTPGSNGQGSALYAKQINLPGGLGELGSISSNYNVYFDPTLPQNSYLLGGHHFGSGGGLLLPWSFVPFDPATADAFGLTGNQKVFADALNDACISPRGQLTARCVELQGLTVPLQKQAIASLTPDQVPGQTGLNVRFSATRMDAPFIRLAALRAGGRAPFALNINGIQVPLGKSANLFGKDAKGGGASADDELFRDSPLGVFIQARFNFAGLDDNPNERGFTSQTRTVTAGADYRFSDQFVAGVAFNYTNATTNYTQSSGSMNSDTYMGAVYGSYYFPQDYYVDWVANYGGNNYNFNRHYAYYGFNGQTGSNPTGNQYSFAVSSGKEFNWQEWLFNPYVRTEFLDMHIDSYQEGGGGGFAMTTGGQTNQSFVSDFGMQVSHAVSLPWGVVTPALRVEWEHQYLNSNRSIGMRISEASAGRGNFSIQTGNPDRDYANLGGSLSAALPNGGGLFVRYETRLGQAYISEHVVEGGVRLTF